MDQAAKAAKCLHDRIRKNGGKNAHGLRDRDATAEIEAGGAAAELAASLILRVPWTASIADNYFGPDIGVRTQVRSSNKLRRSHCLIVRERDLDKYGNVPFVLVIQTFNTFKIHGWMMSVEATTAGNLWDGGDSGRPPAWFVPEAKLYSIDTLKDI